MTTTRIWLDLPDDLARYLGDDDETPEWEGDGELYVEELWLLAREAVQAQWPRLIAVGDRANWIGSPGTVYNVGAIRKTLAWIWTDEGQSSEDALVDVCELTHVDNKATS